MIRHIKSVVAAVAATTLLGGCKHGDSADDDFAPAILPKVYAFQGKVEAKDAGTWVSADGSSTLVLGKDGSLQIKSVEHSMKGTGENRVSGKWLADGNSLLFQYSQGSGAATTLKYTAMLEGNTLTLSPEGSRKKTIYKRK